MNKLEFINYSNNKKGSYEWGENQILLDLKCLLDGTPLIEDYNNTQIFCPNCTTIYEPAKSQEELNEQKSKITKKYIEAIKKFPMFRRRYETLIKLAEKPKEQPRFLNTGL